MVLYVYSYMYIYSARAGASNSSVISVFKHIGLVKYRLAKNKSVEYAGKHILHISRPLLFFFFFSRIQFNSRYK